MGRITARTALIVASSWVALGACGQSNQDFFDDPETTSATSSTSTSTSTASSSETSSSAGGTTAAGGATGSALTTSSATSAGGSGAATSGTASTSDSGTTGTMNDPECPGTAPEGTSMCNVMAGLSCSYGEETCVCSGLTWNCSGGEDEDTTGTGGSGNFGSSNDGRMFGGTGSDNGAGGSAAE